jgi:hypothetical protein
LETCCFHCFIVDGKWSEFSPVTWNNDCSSTCDYGVETGTKTRSCTNPAPAHGGKTCDGASSAIEIRQCKHKECPSKSVVVFVSIVFNTWWCYFILCRDTRAVRKVRGQVPIFLKSNVFFNFFSDTCIP